MQPIDDKDVAVALRAKVSDFNLRGVAVPAAHHVRGIASSMACIVMVVLLPEDSAIY